MEFVYHKKYIKWEITFVKLSYNEMYEKINFFIKTN